MSQAFSEQERRAVDRAIRDLVEQERTATATATALSEREAEFLRLKADGLDRCAAVLAENGWIEALA